MFWIVFLTVAHYRTHNYGHPRIIMDTHKLYKPSSEQIRNLKYFSQREWLNF